MANNLEEINTLLAKQQSLTLCLEETLLKQKILLQQSGNLSCSSQSGGAECIPTQARQTQATQTEQNKMRAVDMSKDQLLSKKEFSFTVENISQLKTKKTEIHSPAVCIGTLPWKIMLKPNDRALGVFLECNGEDNSPSWSCKAKFELKIKSFSPNARIFSRDMIEHLFYGKENDYGYRNFITWEELEDPERGFIRNGAITVCVDVEQTDKLNEHFSKDPLLSEATFSFTVSNIRQLKTKKIEELSPAVYIRMLPWKILLKPNERALGIFLQCNDGNDSPTWSCNAKFELRIKSYTPNAKPFARGNIEHRYCAKDGDFGYRNFITWLELEDAENGLICNGAITVEVHVVADVPDGLH